MGVYKNNSGTLDLLAGGTTYADNPIGSIIPFGGDTAPNGWFLCQGQSISRTTYAELFAVIGTSFGAGDGSTTFNIPDMREVVPVGSGTSARSGIATHDTYSVGGFKDDQMQSHTHPGPSDGLIINTVAAGTNGGQLGTGMYWKNGASYSTGTDTGRKGTTTHGKQLGVNYIIKALQISLPTDFESAVDDKISANMIDSITDGSMKAVTSNAVYDAILSKINTLGAIYENAATELSFTAGVDKSVTHSIANLPAGKYSISYRIRNGESSSFSFYNYTDGCGLWQGSWSGTETKSVGKIATHSGGTFTRASVWKQMLNTDVNKVGITMQLIKVGIV